MAADSRLVLQPAACGLCERVVEMARAVELLDELGLAALKLLDVRDDRLDEPVKVLVLAQRSLGRDVLAAGRTLFARAADALLDALATEPVQALHHDRGLLDDAEAHGALEIRAQHVHGDRARHFGVHHGRTRLPVDVEQRAAFHQHFFLELARLVELRVRQAARELLVVLARERVRIARWRRAAAAATGHVHRWLAVDCVRVGRSTQSQCRQAGDGAKSTKPPDDSTRLCKRV